MFDQGLKKGFEQAVRRLHRPSLGLLCVCFALLALLTLRKPSPPEVPIGALPVRSAPVPSVDVLATTLDPAEVFHRALWRRPLSDDTIVNAQRRDWSDAQGVTHWDWFLEVRPSANLQAWFETNPFSLHLVNSLSLDKTADGAPIPDWFPKDFDGMEVFEGFSGNLRLIRALKTSSLFLSDSGSGFARPSAP